MCQSSNGSEKLFFRRKCVFSPSFSQEKNPNYVVYKCRLRDRFPTPVRGRQPTRHPSRTARRLHPLLHHPLHQNVRKPTGENFRNKFVRGPLLPSGRPNYFGQPQMRISRNNLRILNSILNPLIKRKYPTRPNDSRGR